MSMMVSFVLSFFPRDVLDEILNLIESVSEDFPSYSFMLSLSDDNKSEVIEAFNSTSRIWMTYGILIITFLIAWSIIFTLQNFS